MIISYGTDFFEPNENQVIDAVIHIMDLENEKLSYEGKKKISDFVLEYSNFEKIFEDELKEFFQEDAQEFFEKQEREVAEEKAFYDRLTSEYNKQRI